MNKLRTAGAALVVATVAMGLVGCAPSKKTASDKSAASGSATLTIASTTDVVNLNPLVGNSRTDDWVTDLMYPRLMTINADGSKAPYLAKSWGYTNGGKTGYFELRNDFKWSDGTPVTAKDVAYTLNVLKTQNPKGNTVNGFMTNMITAQAVSDTRVEITMKQPDSILVPEVGFWSVIVPQEQFSQHNPVDSFTNSSNWISAGPYKLTSIAKGQSYTLDRVTPYPMAPNGTPTASKVVYRIYPDVNTEILALEKGDVDAIANALPPAQVAVLQKQSGITLEKIPGLGFAHMTYNMKRKPLDNVLVRQALAHAVDYNAIRQIAVQGQAISANSSPITPSLPADADPSWKEYNYDPQQSKQLLQQAGVSNLKLSMIYSMQDPVVSSWASIVKDDAAKAGITINLQGMDRNTYLAKTAAGDYDIYAGSFAIMDEPVSNMALQYLPGGAINYSQVDDPKLTSLIKQAQATTDPAQVKPLVQQAATYVQQNVIDNVMYVQNLYVAHSSKWGNFVVKPSELLSIVDPQSLANATKTG